MSIEKRSALQEVTDDVIRATKLEDKLKMNVARITIPLVFITILPTHCFSDYADTFRYISPQAAFSQTLIVCQFKLLSVELVC